MTQSKGKDSHALWGSDVVLAEGAVAAPFFPGGSVLSAAMSEVSQGNEGSLADQSETSGSENDDQGAFSTNLGGYTGVGQDFSEFIRGIASGGIPMDINALVQYVMRESYSEQLDDLKFYADKVKHFNAQKEAVRDHLTDLRDQAAKLPVGEDLVIPITTTEVAEDGSQVEVESSITLSIEDIEAIETALDVSYAEDNARSETTLGEDTLQSFIPGPGRITVGEIASADRNVFEGDESNTNAEKSELRGDISLLREEILTMRDELQDWSDGETRIITFTEPDPYSSEDWEQTKAMTKEEAKSLIAKWEKMLTALEERLNKLSTPTTTNTITGSSPPGMELPED